MPNQLLREEAISPSVELIQAALGDAFAAYMRLCEALSAENITMEWRWYNDGKAWLCKCASGKKTVLWLSIWEGFCKLSFYFTEKTRAGVEELPISQEYKTFLPPIGRLLPLVLELRDCSQLDEMSRVVAYKKA